MAEAITAGMARGYEVMRRKSISYDYEKVFWNSTFTVGLIGLGWAAIKLGRVIGELQGAAEGAGVVVRDITTAIADPPLATYEYLYDYVEGDKKDYQPTGGWGVGTPRLWTLIQQYRADPAAWAVYKETYVEAKPEWGLTAKGVPPARVEEEPLTSVKILEAADDIYARYGAAMPLGAVVSHVVLEYARVHRMRRELRE